MNFHRARGGFTLIELLVVIAIIGILASVVLASLSSAREKARDTERRATLHQIRNALEMYSSVHGSYPPNPVSGSVIWDSDVRFLQELVNEGYLPIAPKDPQSPSKRYGYYLYGGACGWVVFSNPENLTNLRATPSCGGIAGSTCGVSRDCISGGGI